MTDKVETHFYSLPIEQNRLSNFDMHGAGSSRTGNKIQFPYKIIGRKARFLAYAELIPELDSSENHLAGQI